jgi:hypothetical protein
VKGLLSRLAALAVISLVASLAVGATAASANHGPGVGLRAGVDDLVTRRTRTRRPSRVRIRSRRSAKMTWSSSSRIEISTPQAPADAGVTMTQSSRMDTVAGDR